MEIIDKRGNPPSRGPVDGRNIYVGALLVVIGAVWLLYNFDIVGYRFFDLFFSWETLLIAVGGYLLALRKWVAGGTLAALGTIMLTGAYFDVQIPVGKIVLPAVIIVLGLVFLFPGKR